MFPRIREITDSLGERLRISVEEHPAGALVVIERTDQHHGRTRILLDGYGVDVLAGFIMSARLAVPQSLPEEVVDGPFSARLRLILSPAPLVELSQPAEGTMLEIPTPFWDRLYAELCLVTAHARELSRRAEARLH